MKGTITEKLQMIHQELLKNKSTLELSELALIESVAKIQFTDTIKIMKKEVQK